jgi:hypothetical protein
MFAELAPEFRSEGAHSPPGADGARGPANVRAGPLKDIDLPGNDPTRSPESEGAGTKGDGAGAGGFAGRDRGDGDQRVVALAHGQDDDAGAILDRVVSSNVRFMRPEESVGQHIAGREPTSG